MWLVGCAGQPPPSITPFTTVQTDAGGFLLPEQAAYDVQHYDLALSVDPDSQTIAGVLTVRAEVLEHLDLFVLDLTPDLSVHSTRRIESEGTPVDLSFRRVDSRIWIELDRALGAGESVEIAVAYGGSPRTAPLPPWVGGFTWSRSDSGSPWIGVSCQVDGADLWWPCKEHPSDEPDDGVTLHYTVPESLVVPANGRLERITHNDDGTRTFHWSVGQPINTYDVTFNAGPFVELRDTYASVSGDTIPVFYWVLPEHEEIGRTLFADFLGFLRFLEEQLGPYPFRSEKCGMVETPYLAMEHQTVIAYGHAVDDTLFGFHETMLHELGHEWWGNLVSARDWNDFWLHEGFDGYLEALYTESIYGPNGYLEYMARVFRPPILNRQAVAPRNSRTIRQMFHAVPPDFVRLEVDIYAKGAWVLHTLRYLLGDETFFEVLRRWAYPDAEHARATDGGQCRIVTTDDFVRLTEEVSGRNLAWFFEVYLRQPALPALVTTREDDALLVEWAVPEGLPFPMPIEIERDGERSRIAMPGGRGMVDVGPGSEVTLDPDFRILRSASPDPDQFGTIGGAGGPGPGSRQGQDQGTDGEPS